ncbi:hypothetical protein AB833_27840 [Chromatiales bacterium (ex Bugula neritina AB1)]|nr:hypothetical protein AB833_27840 [Chromatiales bacterium (ex Bugula neritina AB1)]
MLIKKCGKAEESALQAMGNTMKINFSAALLALATTCATASDHLDSTFLDTHPEWDIGDLFLWKGEQTGGPVFAMTFNPLTGSNEKTAAIKLDPKAVYQFKIDTDNDYVADLAYKLTVKDYAQGSQQTMILRRATGDMARSNEADGEVIATGDTSIADRPVNVVEGDNNELLFAGPRQDPFFFNFKTVESPVALGLRFALGADGLPSDGTSANTFGPTNMTFVALEVPELKGVKFNAWCTTSVDGNQVDRAGRAAMTAIFTPNTPPGRNAERYPWRKQGDHTPKQDYNMSTPSEDLELWSEMVAYRLDQVQVGENKVQPLVDFFLPDVLEYNADVSKMGYPNGRNLKEDAIYWTINKINPFLYYDKKHYNFPMTSDQKISASFPYAVDPVKFKK